MSDASVRTIMERISVATPESPIVVFADLDSNKLNAVFGSTTGTHAQLKTDINFVGSFDRDMDLVVVEEMLLDKSEQMQRRDENQTVS